MLQWGRWQYVFYKRGTFRPGIEEAPHIHRYQTCVALESAQKFPQRLCFKMFLHFRLSDAMNLYENTVLTEITNMTIWWHTVMFLICDFNCLYIVTIEIEEKYISYRYFNAKWIEIKIFCTLNYLFYFLRETVILINHQTFDGDYLRQPTTCLFLGVETYLTFSAFKVRLLMLPNKKQKHKTKIRQGDNPQYLESFLLHRVNPGTFNSIVSML